MDMDVRLQIVFALLLTAVTFKNQVTASIPQVSYFTTLDKYVFTCFIITCAVAVETALFPLIARWWGQSDSWRDYNLLWAFVWDFTSINATWASYITYCLIYRRRRESWVQNLADYIRALARNRTVDSATRQTLLRARIKEQQYVHENSAQLDLLVREFTHTTTRGDIFIKTPDALLLYVHPVRHQDAKQLDRDVANDLQRLRATTEP